MTDEELIATHRAAVNEKLAAIDVQEKAKASTVTFMDVPRGDLLRLMRLGRMQESAAQLEEKTKGQDSVACDVKTFDAVVADAEARIPRPA